MIEDIIQDQDLEIMMIDITEKKDILILVLADIEGPEVHILDIDQEVHLMILHLVMIVIIEKENIQKDTIVILVVQQDQGIEDKSCIINKICNKNCYKINHFIKALREQ